MKLNILKRAVEKFRRMVYGPKRYKHLFKTISHNRCRKILEIGTWNGRRAKQMIERAKQSSFGYNIEYYGFDLFEQMTQEVFEEELSKKPPTRKEVEEFLQSTGAKIQLFQGSTHVTLPKAIGNLPKMDFIFIDGGHSLETVANDWEYCSQLMNSQTVLIFDDYYFDRSDVGAKKTVAGIDRNLYDIQILKPQDRFKKDWGVLSINFAQVTKR